jgi:hypothetical protein
MDKAFLLAEIGRCADSALSVKNDPAMAMKIFVARLSAVLERESPALGHKVFLVCVDPADRERLRA